MIKPPRHIAKRSNSTQLWQPNKLPQVNIESLDQTVIDVGVATRLIPESSPIIKKTDFIETVSKIDNVVNTVYDDRAEVINGSALTRFWTDTKKQKQQWAECEILSKIDQDKFLVFIHQQNFYKIISA